jgi:uncharacterized protein (TIGR02246 family)
MAHCGIFIIAALLSPSSRFEGDDSDRLRKEIEASNAAFSKEYDRGDAKALAQMYTERGQLFPPNEKIVEGRTAIESHWKAAMEAGVKQVVLKTTEVWALGETVAETGTYRLAGKDGESLDEGKYVVIWKRVDGNWKLHRDCWNSSQPAGK